MRGDFRNQVFCNHGSSATDEMKKQKCNCRSTTLFCLLDQPPSCLVWLLASSSWTPSIMLVSPHGYDGSSHQSRSLIIGSLLWDDRLCERNAKRRALSPGLSLVCSTRSQRVTSEFWVAKLGAKAIRRCTEPGFCAGSIIIIRLH
jgi:hypothetical protein